MLTLAILGRPNVGKSTLFNRIIGRRQAIVDDQPGVTRDRLYGHVTWNGRRIEAIDTGGYLKGEEDRLGRAIVENAEAGIAEADVIVMVTDGRDGVTVADQDLADLLRRQNKPVILAVNKIDHISYEAYVFPFHELGIQHVLGVSAIHGAAVGDLLDLALELGPPQEVSSEEETEEIKITILGRPNVGKSTLLNRLAGKERSLVDPTPGTTRDPVDTLVEKEGVRYRFVDTAGIRAAGKIGSDVERYGIARAKRTLERSDVALLLIDAADGPTESDARVFSLAAQAGRSCVLLVNKWDLLEKETGTAEAFEKEVRRQFTFLSFAPVLFLSALSGQRVHRVYELIDRVYAAARQRIPSSQLGHLLDEIKMLKPPPSDEGHSINLYYWTQTGTAPIEITLFSNRPQALPENYKRFLLNQLYERFDLTGCPIKLVLKKSPKREKPTD